MKTVAFLSYNPIKGFTTGWHEKNGRKALVIHNEDRTGFLAEFTGEFTDNGIAKGNPEIHTEVANLWKSVKDSIDEIDQIVIYCGTYGSEVVTQLMSQFPAEKVTYVLCTCLKETKQKNIVSAKHQGARQIQCECHGIRAMPSLCISFLKTGLLNYYL